MKLWRPKNSGATTGPPGPQEFGPYRLHARTSARIAGLDTNWRDLTEATLTNQGNFPMHQASGSGFHRLGYPWSTNAKGLDLGKGFKSLAAGANVP